MLGKTADTKITNKTAGTASCTGIPPRIKQHFESISGLSFDDVRIHYASGKPAKFKAHAYTQGSQVFIAPGQEKYLNHELGHVIQQKQGRVKPDSYLDGYAINDSAALEREADLYADRQSISNDIQAEPACISSLIQRQKWTYSNNGWSAVDEPNAVPSEPPTPEETALLLQEYGEDITIDTAPPSYLKELARIRGMNTYGACQSLTLHSRASTVPITDPYRTGDKRTLMYTECPGTPGVRERRIYSEGEDIHRFLRWFATSLAARYGIQCEIQCYYDTSNGCIVISANQVSEIAKLAQHTPMPYGSLTKRQRRHLQHLSNLYFLNDQLNTEDAQDPLDQLNTEDAQGPLDQLQLLVVGDPTVRDCHAEQRILNYFENMGDDLRQRLIDHETVKTAPDGSLKLRPELLGGLRRACFACSYACFLDEDRQNVHPGPFWPTKSAVIKMKEPDLQRLRQGILDDSLTFATLTDDLTITYDYDTDSEDDTEDVQQEMESHSLALYERILHSINDALAAD